jgi:hypothetical protein
MMGESNIYNTSPTVVAAAWKMILPAALKLLQVTAGEDRNQTEQKQEWYVVQDA